MRNTADEVALSRTSGRFGAGRGDRFRERQAWQQPVSNRFRKRPYTRRIVERTRLLELLDREAGRTIILLAPAGYGKTTLARQWLDRVGGAWVTVTAASGDIPVLARDLAAAFAQVGELRHAARRDRTPGCRTPAEQASMVARTILGQFPEPLERVDRSRRLPVPHRQPGGGGARRRGWSAAGSSGSSSPRVNGRSGRPRAGASISRPSSSTRLRSHWTSRRSRSCSRRTGGPPSCGARPAAGRP